MGSFEAACSHSRWEGRIIMKTIAIIGGGTFSHVRNHLSLCAPAFGKTAQQLDTLINNHKAGRDYKVLLYLTRMAKPESTLETNDDISRLLDHLIADPEVKCIIFNPALVDFDGQVNSVQSGKHATRLSSSQLGQQIELTAADKLIGKIRATRKDIFVVGFKTTTNASPDEQYGAALKLLKTNSLNLVLANDTVTRRNVIVAPEEAQYSATFARESILRDLVDMTLSRMSNTFTRSTVVPGEAIPWSSDDVPANLRAVVDFCIEAGAYKTVLGKTAGHFAVKLDERRILTSIRKSNFNQLDSIGMVKVETIGQDAVKAYGFKPSVGGQSQRIIFAEHEEDCIVHFHCPPKSNSKVPTRSQWQNECGSHECGKNTSAGLTKVDLGDGESLKVVYLDNHGPNIVFSRNTSAHKVQSFIERTFDLHAKTGGLVPASIQ